MTCDLLFRRWPGLEIDRIISKVTASPMVPDNKGYVNIAQLCQLVGLINQGRLSSAQPFASFFRWVNSHDKSRGFNSLRSRSKADDTLNTQSSI